MFTKTWVHNLNEDALRKEVLLPLLRAMGHQDVAEYHGGAGEQGKDIVSWKPDELDGRRNYALVVKATPISGKATGMSSAGEVATQVQQCFGNDFLDIVTGEPRPVHECLVVTNKAISKEARQSIESVLRSSGLYRNVKFIDGDKLWELVDHHLPPARAMQRLQEAQQVFEGVDERYRPTVALSGPNISMGIQEKYPGALKDNPLTMSASINIPTTPEYESLVRSVEQHVATGAPVEIPGEFVKLTLPDGLAKLVGENPSSVRLGPIQNPLPLLVRIKLECDDGETFALDYVHLTAKQLGRELITLSNDDQPIPIHLQLEISPATQTAGLQFHFGPRPVNAHQFAQILRLQSCLSKAFKLRVIHLDTEIEVMAMTHPAGMVPPLPEGMLAQIDDLVAIQRRLGRPITIPDRDATEEEAIIIAKLRTILHNGEWMAPWSGNAEIQVAPADARDFLCRHEQEGSQTFGFIGQESETLFGVELPLGSVIITVEDTDLTNEAEIRSLLSGPLDEDATITLRFVAGPNATVRQQYQDWVPPNIAELIKAEVNVAVPGQLPPSLEELR